MRTRRLVAITVAAAAVGLSGCSAASPGNETADTSSAAPSSEKADDPALAVDTPKNLKAVTDACSLLTAEQLKALGGDGAPKAAESIFGESECSWQGDNFGAIVGINTTTGMGPERIQQQVENAENSEATKVAGYPAARVDEQSALCRIEVGVAEEQAFTVNYSKHAAELPEMADTCGYGEKIAAEVLKNIPDA